MKKPLIIFIGVCFLLSVTGSNFAQEKPASGKSSATSQTVEPDKSGAAGKAEKEKPKEAQKKITAKPSQYRMGGVVTAIDAKAQEITIKQQRVKKERTVSLKLNQETAKNLTNLKVGDLVNVWVKGGIVTVLQRP